MALCFTAILTYSKPDSGKLKQLAFPANVSEVAVCLKLLTLTLLDPCLENDCIPGFPP